MKDYKDLGGITKLLKPETAGRLMQAGEVVNYTRGSVVFHKGGPGDSAMVVLSGTVKVWSMTRCGQEVIVAFMTPGTIMGEISVLDGGSRTSSATCITDAHLFVIKAQDIMEIMDEDPGVARMFAESAAKKFRESTMIAEALRKNGRMRTMLALLRLSELVGHKTRDGIAIDLAVRQSDLANYVGVSRSNFSRFLSELEQCGAINRDGHEIMTVNADVLRKLSHAESN
ncbi:MAG: Crp/Fnr family transcriptional regulator [Pseudomonadota bacterium]